MHTDVITAAPLVNLLVYLSAILVMIGTARWLDRRPAAVRRAMLAEPDSLGGQAFPPALRLLPLDFSAQLQGLAGRWQRFSLFAWLETGERMALWAVLGVTVFLRVAWLETVPGTVSADELAAGGDALGILHGQGPSLFGLDWNQQSALGVHLISWSWRLFGVPVFTERLRAPPLPPPPVVPLHCPVRRGPAPPGAPGAPRPFRPAH